MIVIPDILTLMRKGFYYEGIRFGMSVDELRSNLGKPGSAIGDGNIGYIVYDFLRIGFIDKIIDEIAIFFNSNEELKFSTNLDDEIDYISTCTKIHQLIKLFNMNGIEWHAEYHNNELDYVSLTIGTTSVVTFDLNTGLIYRISFGSGLD